MKRFLAACKTELNALWRSPWQLALVSYIPLLGVLCLWWLFSAGLPRQLPVAVVDLDNSQISRMLTRQLQANPVVAPVHYVDTRSAVAAMQQAKVYGLVVLPADLTRDLLTGHSPTIDIRYNSQFLLVGKLLSSQVQLSMANGLMQVAGKKQLLQGVPKAKVAVNLNPVQSQTTALFNRNNNYVGFLVPPVLIALWQLVAMLAFANSLSRELASAGEICQGAPIWQRIGAKMTVFTPLLMLHGGFILLLLYGYLALPAAGSLALLWGAQWVMLLAVWVLVLLVFFVMRDAARVVSFGTALFAPAFAFMGVTFPTQEMPQFAQWWRLIMPSSHYIDTHISIVSYGAGWQVWLLNLGSYWGYLLLLPLLWLLARKHAPTSSEPHRGAAI